MAVRIWSIFNQDERLVLALSDEPGEFNFTRVPEEGSDVVECAFATLQCYDCKVEGELLTLLTRSTSIDEFLDRLVEAGFRVSEGRPKAGMVARL